MKTILITGFEPFEGERVNSSWEVASHLHGQRVGRAKVIAKQLPCVFGASLTALYTAIDELQPEIVIAIGQANGRPDITVERVAINVDDARIPDNVGQQPIDVPIIANGPAAWFSRLPIKAMVEGMREAGIPASVSQTAGTFVCNHVMYGLLHYLAQHHSKIRGGFMHLPYLPEQAVNHPGSASMPVQTMVQALEIALSIALIVRQDIRREGGATQ